MSKRIPLKEVEWKEVKYLRQGESLNYDYTLILPEPLASWDVYDYWERPRVKAMERELKYGDTLFDIGTESGWCSLVYAKIVGPQNTVLMEPTPEFWPNIKATWQNNFNVSPLACYVGLLSNVSNSYSVLPQHIWPDEAEGDLIDKNKYVYIHDNGPTQQITVDDYVQKSGIIPKALTIDVEGAEFLVLTGASGTLKDYKPKLFVSIHPDLMERDYGTTKKDISLLLSELGYKAELLGIDHEEHWYYE